MQNDYNPQYQLTIETHDLFIWDEHLEKEIEIDPKDFLKGSTS